MLYSASVLAITRISFVRAFRSEALLPAPYGASRFVIRATHERGVGVPSSRSLSTASREANPLYGGRLRMAQPIPSRRRIRTVVRLDRCPTDRARREAP